MRKLKMPKARQVLAALDGKGGVELADLVNSGFLAMVAAVESYQPENGAFSTWFMYHLKTAFAETTGYRTRRSRNDPIQCAVSLSTPLSDDGEAGELDLTLSPIPAAWRPWRAWRNRSTGVNCARQLLSPSARAPPPEPPQWPSLLT